MAKYRCTVCNYVYDEDNEPKLFSDLPEEWVCPVCGSAKTEFIMLTKKSKLITKDHTVSDVLIEQLAEWGVKYVFGIPGTSTLGIVDAIRKSTKIKFFQVRHEQVAAFMASAYGKLTGNVAVCLGVSGPGATNLATGLYDANLDKSPVLAITGLVARQLMGPGSIQEIDQYSFFEPICVFNKILMAKNQTTTLATLAVKHSLLDRGVSHLGVPRDVQKIPYETKILPLEGRITNLAFRSKDSLLIKAAHIIDESKRPVIIAGFGAISQGMNVLTLAEKISAPIITTFRAKGICDANEPLYVGSHGTIASTAAAELVRKADLLIVIGASYSDQTRIPEKKTIQIDINMNMIAKNYPVAVGLIGNSAIIVPRLTERVQKHHNSSYLTEIKQLKNIWLQLIANEANSSSSPIRAQYIMKVLSEKIPDNAVISLDVGENAWWFGRNFQMKSTQKMIMSGYLASMGFGLPGALAASIAYPDRMSVCISGDGGFSMVMNDFLTAMKYALPIKVFVLNNQSLGMIMQEQKVEGYQNWQTNLYNFDYAKFAENSGGLGIKVINPEDLEEAIDKCFSTKSATIVDINTDPKRF
ncbi:MAG TPA: thiamine pyrophosphate-dependent enzyme [Candidatus Glassbacteria bacterium]|nr:thiamine pyrophosphate-dependent enzyme [Candidatus Glassbacteria bacterium]